MPELVDHPVWKVPSLEDAGRLAALLSRESGASVSVQQAWERLESARRKRIADALERPLTHGWEPSIWWIADALLGMDWVLPPWLPKDFGPRVRRLLLGRNRPLRVLQINGGNRSGKTTYTCKRALQCAMHFERATLWDFHTDSDMSVTAKQNVYWSFIPPEYKPKRQLKTDSAYLAFKEMTGFAESRFILPGTASRVEFRNYRQEKDKIEGGELGAKCPVKRTDELFEECLGYVTSEHVPADWIETLGLRLATRGARGIVEFTPTNGYSPAVKLFQQGMTVVRWTPAWLLPVAKVEPAVARQMQIEDCARWIEDLPAEPAAAQFEQVPRVAVCANKEWGVLWMHSSDNPFGNPAGVWGEIVTKHTAFKRERFYGVADKEQAGAFPLFNEAVHVSAHAPRFEIEDAA